MQRESRSSYSPRQKYYTTMNNYKKPEGKIITDRASVRYNPYRYTRSSFPFDSCGIKQRCL